MTLDAAAQAARAQRQKGKTVVLATGVFDVLHSEHVLFLQKAKQLGDFLLVGIESDSRVRATKGKDRPVNTQQARLQALDALQIADAVFILPEQFHTPEDRLKLLRQLRPQYLAVSSHSPFQEKKQSLMRQVGGELKVVHKHNPAVSTSLLLQRQKK